MEMNNFNSVFDELSKLYEEAPKAAQKDTKLEEAVKESCSKKLIKEAAEDENVIEIEDEDAAVEAPEEEPKQLVLECSKCGALVIKSENDVMIDEESDLANVEDACEYCEETEGYKIVGSLVPYETVESTDIEEGLFSKKPSHALIIKYKDGGKANNAKSDWYCFATSSDQAKLKKEEARLKSEPNYTDVELKVVDMKTAKNLVHKDEFAGAENLDEAIEEESTNKEELEEILDFDVPINITANDNNVAIGGMN